ncbi:MAG TPA: hypothetical protein VK012_03350, partial [Gemmatimonadales bacterium]|nr:hypothetical protein [Gemmatimonadales bacterium]
AYRFVTDSAGRFVMAPLPAGTYHVTAALDPDRDRRRTGREPYDTLTTATTDARPLELWTFPHDTTGPRIAELTSSDSLAVRIRFSQHLDPSQQFDSTDISVRQLPDSAPVPAVTLLRQEQYDSLYRQVAPVPADSLAPAADTAAARARPDRVAADTAAADSGRARMDAGLKGRTGGSEPGPSRPALSDQLVLRMGAPLMPGRSYLIEVTGVRNASGVAADVSGVLQVPVPAAPLPADSLAPPAVPPAPADSGLPIRR